MEGVREGGREGEREGEGRVRGREGGMGFNSALVCMPFHTHGSGNNMKHTGVDVLKILPLRCSLSCTT